MILDYTLCSINKNIVFKVEDRFYNSEEVVTLIKELLREFDHALHKQLHETS